MGGGRMRKLMGYWLLGIITFIFLFTSIAFAQGKSNGEGKTPKGWKKGEKKGWGKTNPSPQESRRKVVGDLPG